jgi:putative Ca2+/H+ antiporter (TMEM165/GDT1 family)
VIFVAELGDKSQLMALTFATRYRFWTVLAGITVATAVVHLVSVALGVAVGVKLPTDLIGVLAGLAFIAFGLWTLRGDELTEADEERARRNTRSAFWAVTVTFFLAELGDKTMLATITLATREGWFGTWLGSTVGMVLADALAIGVGVWLGKSLPERVVKIGAATLFFIFGAVLIGGVILD